MRPILFILFMLILYMCIGTLLGIKWIFIISAVAYAAQSTVYLMKEEYYVKFMSFISPSYLKISEEKGQKFKKENRTTNIICWYFIAVVFIIQAFVIPNTKLLQLCSPKQLIVFAVTVFVFSCIMVFISMLIHKKSKSNAQLIGYSAILGVLLVVIIMIITGFFIFKDISIHIATLP